MKAWNIYLTICTDHMPSLAPSLVAYQYIITLTNNLYPLESWLNYDVQFQTLAASNILCDGISVILIYGYSV